MLQQARFFVIVVVSVVVIVLLQQIARNAQLGGHHKWNRLFMSNDKSAHNNGNVLGFMGSLYGLITQRRLNSKESPNETYNKKGNSQHQNARTGSVGYPYYFTKDSVYQGKRFIFRPTHHGRRRMDQQYKHFEKSIQNGFINFTRLATMNLNKQHLEPFERWVVEEAPIRDVKDAADEIWSRVLLVNSTGSRLRVGDVVTIRIDVFNGRNVHLLRGGDEIRVWIKGKIQIFSLAVDVEDMMNGSYIARIPLKWAGNSTIFVSLAYPREILRAILYLRTIMRAVRLNAAGFTSGHASFTKNIEAHRSVDGLCNLTSANYGRSWYCDKPTDPNLTCEHWTDFQDMDFPEPLPLAKGEKAWFDRIWGDKRHYLRIIPLLIELQVEKSDYEVLAPRPLCSKRPPRETWLEKSPRGMINQLAWVPFGCRLRHTNSSLLMQRLANHTVYMIGDSNLRIWQEVLINNHICYASKVDVDKVTGRKHQWHDPTDCFNIQYNFAIKWLTHTFPFHTNPKHWAGRGNMKSVATTLDGIPHGDNIIVLIHLYIHFTTHHASVYHDRIRSMRDGVAAFVLRIPTAKVVIRGPHIAYKEWPSYLGGDAQAPLFRQILIDEFKDLYDKVIFLDFWDLSIAGENKEFHPSVFLTFQMMNVFFGYVLD